MNKSELVSIRPMVPADKNFIYASWLRGLYYGESWFSIIPKNAFMEHYHKVIDLILKKPTTKVSIACLKEDADVILGYSVSDESTLHWVFIKKNWRGIGLAKDLSPSEIKNVTHLTKVGLSIINKKKIDFNPFVI